MSSLDKARQTQLRNIETQTGKKLEALRAIIKDSGLIKPSAICDMLMVKFGLKYGDANLLVHFALESDARGAVQAGQASLDRVISEIYSGRKADLRPIHEKLMAAVCQFGPFKVVPKKGYLSLRRKKQFAIVGPATTEQVEVGLNMKGVAATARLTAMPPGGMCQYKVKVTQTAQIDSELIVWMKRAYDTSA